MSKKSDWKPDDSVIEGPPGMDRIKEALGALESRGIDTKNRVITSRDPGMDEVRYLLRRPGMPPGIESWQLPVVLENCPIFAFLTVAQPGAVVPIHSHKRDLFRIVLSGAIITNGIELKTGDWMFVPKNVDYGYSATLNPGHGAIIAHCYG